MYLWCQAFISIAKLIYALIQELSNLFLNYTPPCPHHFNIRPVDSIGPSVGLQILIFVNYSFSTFGQLRVLSGSQAHKDDDSDSESDNDNYDNNNNAL